MLKNRESTLRVAIFREFKEINNIFTVESSFCGCDQGPFANKHFRMNDIQNVGRDLMVALLVWSDVITSNDLININTSIYKKQLP